MTKTSQHKRPNISLCLIAKNVYRGTLYIKKMSPKQRQAYKAYYNLLSRSREYGLPKPSFTKREFMGWWLKSLKAFKGTKPTCGRIDHTKGYSWENIVMQDNRDNARESFVRNKIKERFPKTHRKPTPVLVKDKKSGKTVFKFDSITSAAKKLNLSVSYVSQLISGKRFGVKRRDYSFERGAK